MSYLNAIWTGNPINVGRSDRLDLPGVWVPFKFDYAYAGGDLLIKNSTCFLSGSCYVDGVLDIWFVDFDPEVEIQIRQFENDANGNRLETDYPHEFYTSRTSLGEDYPRTTHHRYPVWSYVNSGHKFGIECSQWSDNSDATVGHITKAQIRLKTS